MPEKIAVRSVSSHRFIPAVFSTFLLTLLTFLTFTIQAQQQLGDTAIRQIQLLAAEKASRTPAQRKIDASLLLAAKQRRNDVTLRSLPPLRSSIETDRQGYVVIDIEADVDDSLLQTITTLGGSVINSHPRFASVRARIPLQQIETLAGLAQIRHIRPALPLLLNKIDTSQGDVAHGANTARTTFSADGSGVQIGVISDSVDALATLQASADLPATVTVLAGQSGNPGSSEGTAMLEIVHDLAPGADLFFATALGGTAQFAQNILDLAAAGCDVIVDDVAYFAEPVFQDGIIAQAVDTVTAAGVQYYSSAGNSGNLNDGTAGVWEGDFVSVALPTPLVGTGYLDAHDFGGGNPGNTITVDSPSLFTLQWSDPQGSSGNDYDLYLLNSDLSAVFDASTNIQNGNDNPFEYIDSQSFNDTGNRLVIVRAIAVPPPEPRYLHLNTNRGRLAVATSGQTSGHNAAAAAFSVAAVNVATAGGGQFTGGAANPVETFSSDGPRRIFYAADGTPVTPGNFLSSGGSVRQKPDLAAADGVATATPGFDPFFGTSAAAPHAAALGVLLLDLNPNLTPAAVRTLYTSTALDTEAAGIDRDSGVGIIMAAASLDAVDTVDTVAPTGVLTPVSNITGSGGTFVDVIMTYSDNVAIDVATIDTGDIQISGLTVNSVSVDVDSDGSPRIATYRAGAPGGSWDEADNAGYTITLQAAQVRDTIGIPVAAASLGSFSVAIDDSAPAAVLTPIPTITSSGATTLDVIVGYRDNTAVDVSTIDSNDLQSSGLTLNSVVIDNTSDGTPRTATYQFTPPGGAWDETDNGSYTVVLQANQIEDTRGNITTPASLGSFTVAIDEIAPTVSLSTPADITTSGGNSITISVTYSDNSAIDVTALDDNDIRVNGLAVSFTGVDGSSNGTPITASYVFSAPGGSWDAADNGSYRITLQAGQVTDTAGNVAAAGDLGSFAVGIFENRMFSDEFETP